MDFMQMNLAKSDMRISETYTDPLPETENHDRLRRRISEEHDSCVEAHAPAQNPYVDPLSYVQVSLLRRLRALPEDSLERDRVLNTLLLTISGISSGMLNTG